MKKNKNHYIKNIFQSNKMKILLVNKYLFPKGGAEVCTLSTGELLSMQGHKVEYWGMIHPKNPDLTYGKLFVPYVDYHRSYGMSVQIKIALNVFYSSIAKKRFEQVIRLFRPDVVHLHNIAHQISPSILQVVKKYNLPALMTLHDYKLVCPIYTMFQNQMTCEKCKNKKYYWCFLKKCTKNSYLKSLLNTAEMIFHHNIMHIYELVDLFISPSRFLMEKVKEMGFKGNITYIPNFIKAGEYKLSGQSSLGGLCYFGRLSDEKGLFTLIKAMKGIRSDLKIIGDGPQEKELEIYVKRENIKNINFLGYKSGEELKREINTCLAAVLPSEYNENNPFSILEAFASRKAVIGSRIGGIPELIIDGKTGITFQPGNVDDLKKKIQFAVENTEKMSEIGKNARRFVLNNFNSEKYYRLIIRSYEEVIKNKKSSFKNR